MSSYFYFLRKSLLVVLRSLPFMSLSWISSYLVAWNAFSDGHQTVFIEYLIMSNKGVEVGHNLHIPFQFRSPQMVYCI
jgi:hypothetical protein